MSKIFIFGCSYTKYMWPTWADILKTEIGDRVIVNAGCGLGNVAISHLMLESKLKEKWKHEDKIFVVWSSWNREDRFENRWLNRGSIFTGDEYPQWFIDNFWSIENDCMKNMSTIIFANLSMKIDYQAHMVDYDLNLAPSLNKNYEKFGYLEDNMPEKVLFDMDNNSQFNGILSYDSHPDIECHLNFANQVYINQFGKDLSNKTIDYYKNMQYNLIEKLSAHGWSKSDNMRQWEERVTFFKNALQDY